MFDCGNKSEFKRVANDYIQVNLIFCSVVLDEEDIGYIEFLIIFRSR